MKNPILIARKIRDNFDNDFLYTYARMVIAFGRLEGEVKRAIKNLAVSMNLSADFTSGMIEAEKQYVLSAMCDHMLKLHRQKFGHCDEGTQLAEWVRQAKDFAEVRNRIVHGTLTTENDGKPLVMHTRIDRKTRTIEFNELSLSTAGLQAMHEKVSGLWQGLNAIRQAWT
jgi:hypothetical protein